MEFIWIDDGKKRVNQRENEKENIFIFHIISFLWNFI